MADTLLRKRLLFPEQRQGYCCRDDWAPAARRGLQLRRCYLDAIHAPVEEALAVLRWWHGAGAVNDGKETGAELTGMTRGAEKLSGTTGTAAGNAEMPRTHGCAESDGLPASTARRAERSSIWRCML